MTTSQKKFMLGCVIGGVIGALGSFAVPQKYVDNLISFNSSTRKHRKPHKTQAKRTTHKTVVSKTKHR